MRLKLKESLKSLPKRQSPKAEALSWIQRGIDPPDRFDVQFISDYKGFGVFAKQDFRSGEFLLEYRGSLITKTEAEVLELKHARTGEGCFMFFFPHLGKQLCYDATETFDAMARFANDSSNTKRNAKMQIVVQNQTPHLCLFATVDIHAGDEVVYDYGDKNLPWKLKYMKRVSYWDISLAGATSRDVSVKKVEAVTPASVVSTEKASSTASVLSEDSDSDPFEVNGSETSDSDSNQDELTNMTTELKELHYGKGPTESNDDLDKDVEMGKEMTDGNGYVDTDVEMDKESTDDNGYVDTDVEMGKESTDDNGYVDTDVEMGKESTDGNGYVDTDVEMIPDSDDLSDYSEKIFTATPLLSMRGDASTTDALPALDVNQNESDTKKLPNHTQMQEDMIPDSDDLSDYSEKIFTAIPLLSMRGDASTTDALPALDVNQNESDTKKLPKHTQMQGDMIPDSDDLSDYSEKIFTATPLLSMRGDASTTDALPALDVNQNESDTKKLPKHTQMQGDMVKKSWSHT